MEERYQDGSPAPDKDFFEDLDILSQQEDVRFGMITLVKERSTGRMMFIKQRDALEQDDHVRDTLQARERLTVTHECILPFLDYKCETRNVEERPLFMFKGLYLFPVYDLSNLLERRKSQKFRLSFGELMDILIAIASALAHLQRLERLHGDIRPKYIGSTSQNHPNWVLMDRLADPAPPHQAQYNHLQRRSELYVSPVMYSAISQGQTRFKHNPFKSDLFSLGLVILECALLKNVTLTLYGKTSLNIGVLSQHLHECHALYGEYPLFLECLGKILAIEETNRPDPLSFMEFVRGKQSLVKQYIQIEGQHDQEVAAHATGVVGVVKVSDQRTEASQIDTERPRTGAQPSQAVSSTKQQVQNASKHESRKNSGASEPSVVNINLTSGLRSNGTQSGVEGNGRKQSKSGLENNSRGGSVVDRSGLSKEPKSALNESANNQSAKDNSQVISHSNQVISIHRIQGMGIVYLRFVEVESGVWGRRGSVAILHLRLHCGRRQHCSVTRMPLSPAVV